MKRKIEKYKYTIIFIFIIVVQIGVMAFYENAKEFYHIDEIYSFESAHNIMLYSYNDEGFRIFNQDKWYNQWHTKEEFLEHFEVRGEQSLLNHSIKEVITGRKSGNIYMYALNIVSSFQPNAAPSKWSGFVLNCFLFVITQLFIYKLVYEMVKDKEKALLSILLYGFSAGAISLTIYIRFYNLCLLCAVLIMYFHIKIWKSDKIWKVITCLIGVAMCVLAVYSYQPYMMTYIGCTVIAFMIVSIIKRKYKVLLQYGVTILVGAGISTFIYPKIWNEVFRMASSEFGKSAITNLFGRTGEEFQSFAKYYLLKTLTHTLAGGTGTLIICIVLIIAIFYAVGAKRITKIRLGNGGEILLLIMTALLFFILQCRVLENKEYRYMSYYYPIICILVAIMICNILEMCQIKHLFIWFSVIILIQSATIYCKGYVDELYLEADAMKAALEQYSECDSILFIEARHAHQYYRDAFLIPDKTEFYATEALESLDMNYEFLDRERGEAVLCWFPNFDWNDEVNDYRSLDRIVNTTDYSSYYKVLETYQSTVYYLY